MDLKKMITNGNRLLAAGKNQQAKELLERVLKSSDSQEPIIHFQCGLANLNLGYLIYAQNMFEKALVLNRGSYEGADPKLELMISTQLGYTYKM